MPWTDEHLRNLPEHVRKLNPHLNRDPIHLPSPGPKPQPAPGTKPVRPLPAQTLYSGRVHIRVQSYRCRPADPDNGFIKYHVDALRHCGFIRDDTPEDIEIQILPDIKVRTRAEERTEIELS